MNILRKIFHKKFEGFEQQINDLKEENISMRNELSDAVSEKEDKIRSLESENCKLKSRAEEIEKENELLRKYYKLGEEPSDEIKAKIHIDLEINRLKEEKIQLAIQAIKAPISYPYPVYFSLPTRW